MLVFGDFAYNARYLWYLVDNCALSVEKNLLALKWAQLGPKMGQNEVLDHFLGKYAFLFGDFAYYDCE